MRIEKEGVGGGERGVEPPTKFSKRGGGRGLDRTSSTLVGGLLEKRGVTFFRGGGVAILQKNKQKHKKNKAKQTNKKNKIK